MEFLDDLSQQLSTLLNNPYVGSLILIFFIFYAGLAAPQLPPVVAKLFDYTLFKVAVLALILFVNNVNPTIALVVAVAFFVTLQTLSRYNLFEMAGELIQIKKLMGMKNGAEKKEAVVGPPEDEMVDPSYGLNMETQVSGLASRTPFYQGPQGLQHPVGFGGDIDGADLQ